MNQSFDSLEPGLVAARQGHAEKIKRWSRLLAGFVSIQIIVQAVSLMAGILLIRKLSQTEYALFTLANSMQATLIMLADVGLMNGLSASGGRVWQNQARFGQLINTGLQLRRKLVVASILVVTPILFVMVIQRGSSYAYASMLIVSVLVGVSFRITNDIFTVVPRLMGRTDRLQKLDFSGGVVRLSLVLVGCATFINAVIAVMASSVSYLINWLMLRHWVTDGADLQQPANDEDRNAIWRVIRQQAPNTIYYCIQGQLVVFIISIFGQTRNIAEVGALGRLAMIFTLVSSVMTNIVVPRFARSQEKEHLVKIYVSTLLFFAILSVLLLTVVGLYPEVLLWLLGKKYQHLHKELTYSILSTVVYAFGGAIYSMNAARAWTKYAWISIPITILGQLVLVPFLDLGSVKDVILLNTIPAAIGIAPYAIESYQSFKQLPIMSSGA